MGDPRNWTPRKVARVREANASADRRWLEAATWEDHGPVVYCAAVTPCGANRLGLTVRVTCRGCDREREVRWSDLEHTNLSHRAWPRVLAGLMCSGCTSVPKQATFWRGRDQVGALVARETPEPG